ncbi:hypothetical protein AV530_016455 [Patagioenas fasciata monilis]|uniref:C2H2-type domain-containing protein n=1 Tax=Patagioenas fasciata monilis TaxID=372326 RepID=A0A1V4J2X2_PATFA|nr:hypothetical protein AV530_016455 [Patagioenas fasciata monilis]
MRNSPQVHVRTCLALQRPPASSSQSGSTLRDASISCFSFQLDQFSHSFSAWLCQFWSWIFRRTRIGEGPPGSKFKNTELILLCEWKECSFVGKCMEEFCNRIAEHLEEYLQHPLETADCLGVFKGKHKLWEHLRTPTQERVVACPTCGEMFSNNTKFFDHAKKQVSEDK